MQEQKKEPFVRRFAFLLVFAAAAVALHAANPREDESFSYNSITHVEIQSVFLDVEIRGDDGASVSMRADLQDDSFLVRRNFSVMHEVSGTTLRVWVEKDSGAIIHGSGTLFFRVPAQTEVTVETASGDVRVNSLSTGNLQARSASGDIQLSDCQTPLIAASLSGDITLRRARGEVDLTSASGDIEMSDVEGAMEAKSISGNIKGTGILLTADSLFKTVSGDIDVDLKNALNDLRYNLSTVSGGLTVGGVRASRGLAMGTGSLLVTGESVSGDQIYR